MIGQQPFFHSPLSPTFFPQEKGQALLLQFIIHELLEAEYLVQTPKITFTPYDWAAKSGTKNKIYEFALLLEIAFPELKERAKTFLKSLETSLQLYRISSMSFTSKSSSDTTNQDDKGQKFNVIFDAYEYKN